jgi:hypothetical protein
MKFSSTRNASAALWVRGVPPFVNNIHVHRSAGDGVYMREAGNQSLFPNISSTIHFEIFNHFLFTDGPLTFANATINFCRGHGIYIDNTTDGRVYINETRIENNFGDGVKYRHKVGNSLQVLVRNMDPYLNASRICKNKL